MKGVFYDRYQELAICPCNYNDGFTFKNPLKSERELRNSQWFVGLFIMYRVSFGIVFKSS